MSAPLRFVAPPTPLAESTPAPTTADLAQTLHTFEQWRAHKTSQSEAIPDTLWHAIFALESHFTAARLCTLFALSQRQYQKKFQTLYPEQAAALGTSHFPSSDQTATVPPSMTTQPPVFCEVKASQPFYQPQPLPTPTPPFIIEFCRADGCIMKIYTSADRFSTLLSTFFAGTDHVAPAR